LLARPGQQCALKVRHALQATCEVARPSARLVSVSAVLCRAATLSQIKAALSKKAEGEGVRARYRTYHMPSRPGIAPRPVLRLDLV
jgi:hypothetical protein